MSGYQTIEGSGAPIKAWTRGVPVEEAAKRQLENVARLPFIHHHVAAMPDVHWGLGATVGAVIPCRGAVVPAAVGVDIGCGMMAVRTSLTSQQLPESLAALRAAIERAVPHGRTGKGRVANDRGAWRDPPPAVVQAWKTYAHAGLSLEEGLRAIIGKYPKLSSGTALPHLGTLGSGNHFIELCLDETDRVWAMLHSGSRGIGNRIGTWFIERAKAEAERHGVDLPDPDLAWLPEGTELFADYVAAVGWAQAFAHANREVMMARVLRCAAPRIHRLQRRRGRRQLPPQLRCRRAALRRACLGHAQRSSARRFGRARHHPRLDGNPVVRRPRQGQSGILPLVLARRWPGDVAQRG